MMRYLAARNVQLVCRNSRGKHGLVTVASGELAPVEVTDEHAAPFVARGFLREVTDEQAARLARGPRPATASELAGRAFGLW